MLRKAARWTNDARGQVRQHPRPCRWRTSDQISASACTVLPLCDLQVICHTVTSYTNGRCRYACLKPSPSRRSVSLRDMASRRLCRWSKRCAREAIVLRYVEMLSTDPCLELLPPPSALGLPRLS